MKNILLFINKLSLLKLQHNRSFIDQILFKKKYLNLIVDLYFIHLNQQNAKVRN
jgi:hypothetical protein